MKEKIKAFFPYILIVIFFTAVIELNGKTQTTEPKYSFKSTTEIPQISLNKKNEAENTESSDSEKTETQPTVQSEEVSCYYTKSGTKYHLDKECRYIKNSTTVNKTDVTSAENFGLEPCTGCAN